MPKAASGIQYGKVHVYSESERLETCLEVFFKVMSRYGWPDEEGEPEREQKGDEREIQEEGDEESPWLKAAREAREGDTNGG